MLRNTRIWRIAPFVAVILALAFPIAALAAPLTTGPGSRLDVFVKITDQKMVVALYLLSDYHGANELYEAGWQDVGRGETATFHVVNDGKKRHNFVFLGKRTPVLRPRQKATFTVALIARGKFVYESTVGKGHRLRGVFVVH